jgi:hypothetical protein
MATGFSIFLATPLCSGEFAGVQTITLNVPDSLLSRSGGSLEQLTEQAQMLLAIKCFELGWLNFGQAAAMCGMERADFLTTARKYGVPVGEWDGV